MENIIVMEGQNTQLQSMDFSSAYTDFISWVDRGEKTTRTYLCNLRQFAAWMSYQGITAPTRDDVIRYKNWLMDEHEAIMYDAQSGWRYRTDEKGRPLRVKCSATTAKQYLTTVKMFFKWTAAAGIYPNIGSNVHSPQVRTDIHRKDALKPKDVAKVEQSISDNAKQREAAAASAAKDAAGRTQRAEEQDKRLTAMFLLMVTCGLRCIEVSRANVEDLEVRDGQAWLRVQGKGHSEKDSLKAVPNEVYQAITEYLECRECRPREGSPLFVATGNRNYGGRIASTTISTMIKKALVTAGYDSKRLTAHSCRHTSAYATVKVTGKNLMMLQHYLRHSDPKTSEIYINTDEDAEEDEVMISNGIYQLLHSEA